MAAVQRLFELLYNVESSNTENAESPGSNTFASKIPVLDYTFTPSQERVPDGGMRGRMNDEGQSNIGVRGWTLEFETYLIGHLTTSAASLTQTWQHDLLAKGFGGSNVAVDGTTVSAATTGSSVTFTANTDWLAGMIGWCGVKGDGKGDGQAFVVNTVAAPMTFLTALPGTPANTDVIYAGQQLYHDESQAYSLSTVRFQCGYSSTPTAGQQFQALGGQLASVTLKFPFGDTPRVRFTYHGTYWVRSAATTPNTSLTIKDQFCAPTASGRFFINDYGTATASTLVPAELDLTLNMGLEPIIGPGGIGVYQNIVGFVRSRVQPTLTVKIPWSSTYETWWDTANQTIANKHILFNANVVDGRRIAFYMPKVFPIGQRPSFPTQVNGQTYVQVMFRGTDDLTGATELTKSALRLAFG